MNRIVKSLVSRGPIVVALVALVAAPLEAANTWDGGGADNNWGTENNWDNNLVPTFPVGLTFQGTTRLTSNNEAAGRTVNGITFTGTGANAAGAFTLTGSAITLGGNIAVSGNPVTATTQTINLDLILNASRAVSTAGATSTVVLNGVISGAFALTKTANNAGALVLSNTNNSFSGKMVLGGGTTSVTSIANSGVNSAIGSGSQIDFGFGTTQSGILNFTGGSGGSTNRAIALIATQNSTPTILNNGANGGGGLVFSGSVTHAATASFTTTLALSGTNTDANTVQSVLADGASGGTLAVTKSGAGTWTLSGANTYTGTTTITQGTLSAASFGTAGSASALGAAGTVVINGTTNAIALNWTGTANESTNKTFAIANTTGGMTFGNLGSGTLTLLNDLTFSGSGNKTLTLRSAVASGTGSIVVAGSISDGANGTVVSVVRGGGAGGRLWLSGTASTFSGGVTVGSNGQLYVPFVGSAGSASPLGTGGTITLGGGNFQGNLTTTNAADETTNKVFLLNGTGTASNAGWITTGSSGRLTVTSALATSGSNRKVLQLTNEGSGGGVDFDGLIADGTSSLTVGVRVMTAATATGGASFRLGNDANSFSNGVSINNNVANTTTTLSVATIGNQGATSALGTSGTITFNGGFDTSTGLLRYTGAGETTDKVVNLAGAGLGGLAADNASGLLKFTSGLVVTSATTHGLTLTGSGAGEFAGLIVDGTGAGNLTTLVKDGAGTWTLSGVNTYTGVTSVSAGTLLVNGAVGGAVNVAGGATLGGSGAVAGLVTVLAGGALSPGNSPGEFTLGSLALDATSTTLMEINDVVRGTSYDGITVTASNGLAYGGVLALVFGNGSAFADNTTFDLFGFAGSASGGFSSVSSSGFYAGTWTNNNDGTFNLQQGSQTLTFSQATGDVVVVPEPGALAIAGVGVVLAGWRLASRRRHARARC